MKKHLEIFFIAVVCCFPFLDKLFSYCVSFGSIDFDTQALFLWEYASSKGIIPYKEIFYPYGLVFYYKFQNIFVHFIYFILGPLIFLTLYILFRKITKNKLLSLIMLILSGVFIMKVIPYDALLRYGILLSTTIITPIIFSSKKQKKIYHIIAGVIAGLFISLILDTGILSVIQYVFIYVVCEITFNKQGIKKITLNILAFFSGVVMGIAPLFIFLLVHNSLSHFFDVLRYLSLLTYVGKTPFMPNSGTPSNIFTFSILIILVFKVGTELIVLKRRTLFTVIEISLIFAILMLEQRSMIRSIDRVITLFSFTALQIVYLELLLQFKRLKTVIIICLITNIVIVLLLVDFYSYMHNNRYLFHVNILNHKQFNSQCIQDQKQKYKSDLYNDVVNSIPHNSSVFVFPSEPILYVLSNSQLPYFSNAYDSSSKYGQEKQIEFLEKNKVNYVVYNLTALVSQDGVPDYIRNPMLNRYIFNNYEVEKKVNKHVILKRKQNADIFQDELLRKIFLTVSLVGIPNAEGHYKHNDLISKGKLLIKGDIKVISRYLSSNKINSSNIVLLYKDNTYRQLDRLTLGTDELSTVVTFLKCNINGCIINLKNIPLFYKDRNITSINTNSSTAEISLYKSYLSELW